MTAKDYIRETKLFFDRMKFRCKDDLKNIAIIVETRQIRDLGTIVKNHLHFLGAGWGLLVVQGPHNHEYVWNELRDIDNYSFMQLPHDKFTEADYNKLLTSYNFWRFINADRALIFQSDSLMLRKGIEPFLQYDYVGAPWKPSHINTVGGNGGLSIRSVSEMKRITQEKKYNQVTDGNEDLFFSKHVKNCAPNHIAQQFSVETLFYPKPIGIHACDKYLSPMESHMIFDKALQEIKETV